MLAIYAVPIGAAITAIAFWVNRQVFGFLPDDLPRPGRKEHRRPIPLAGVALLPSILVFLVTAERWWLVGGAIAVASIGFLDDWQKELGRDLDWRIKLIVLTLAAAMVATGTVDPFVAPGLWCLACLCVLVLTNAANFLDNTDGVTSGMIGTGLLLGSAGQGPLAAAGYGALAFLPWNWPRPVLFLGDSGAYLLGLCAGAVCVERLPDGNALLPFCVPLLDFAQVVIARLMLGLPPWVGDRRHLTHIAQNLGLRRVLVAPVFTALAVTIFFAGS